MPKFKYADIRVELTVKFTDDGATDLNEQAIEAALDKLRVSLHDLGGIEVVGKLRDQE